MNTTNLAHATELISLKEAARRLPSHKPGNHVRLATLYRWIASGRLPAVRRGRWWFVRPEDLEKLHTSMRPIVLAPSRQRAIPAWVRQQLAQHGLHCQ